MHSGLHGHKTFLNYIIWIICDLEAEVYFGLIVTFHQLTAEATIDLFCISGKGVTDLYRFQWHAVSTGRTCFEVVSHPFQRGAGEQTVLMQRKDRKNSKRPIWQPFYDLKIKKESYRSGNMDKLLRMRYIRSCLSLRAGWMSAPGPFQPCISTLLCVCWEVSSYFPTRVTIVAVVILNFTCGLKKSFSTIYLSPICEA